MEIEDLLFIEDDMDILDIIDFGFPRQLYARTDYFNVMDDLTFFKRFRLRKPTVLGILELIDHQLEFENDLNNSVWPINQLLTTLRFYATCGHESSIGDFMGMHQTTVSRIVSKVSNAIAGLSQDYIKMPNQHETFLVQNDFYRHARFPRVIGCLDCTHIKLQSPGGEDAEVFRNRKSFFSINTQVICDNKMLIRNIVARWPGSSHDSTIFNNSRIRARFEAGEFQNSVLLGDSGYPLRSYLLTPLLNPITRPEVLYNESQIRTRNVIERTFGVWKRRFPVLAYGLRCKLDTSLSIIIATAVLHNIACNTNEDIPPLPENINAEEFDYLVQQEQIPQPDNNNVNHDYRRNLINNYFAYL